MRFLIGIGLIIIGGILTAVTEFMPLAIIVFVGVFLFASIPNEAMFCDYVIVNSNEVLLRKRYYILFLPLVIVSYILTLGRSLLKILYKEKYFKGRLTENDEFEATPISRKEYIKLRNEQRKVYSEQTLSKEFMETTYTLDVIAFKHKKIRLILAIVFSCLMLLMLVEPEAFWLTIIYEAVFLPMVILWIPDYKDAKILHNAYEHAMASKDE